MISKDNKIVWSVRVHLFHINCHQVVDLVSYFHLCPTLLRRYINRWDHCPDESTVKLSKTFLSFIWRETAKIIWQFVGWMLLPFKWEKFANVWNLCIVSPLGAVLVHNLEPGGGFWALRIIITRAGSEIAKTEIRRHFQRGEKGSSGLIGTSEGRRGIEV